MGESKTTRVGLIVAAFAAVAVAAVLVWRSGGDDSDEREGGEEESVRVQKVDDGTKGGGDTRVTPRPSTEAKMPPPLGSGTLHDRIGGRRGIRVVTSKLLDVVTTNEAIMADEHIARINVRVLQGHLIDFVCKETGGECEYTEGSVKDALGPLAITAAQWDSIQKDFAAGLRMLKVPEREADDLLAVFGALEGEVVAAP